MDERRLDRIEQKLDDVGEAIVALARMEERMVTLFKRMDKYDERQSVIDSRLSGVESVTVKRGVVYGFFEKGFWLAVGAAMTYIAKTQGG